MLLPVSYPQVHVNTNDFDLKENPSVVNWYRWSDWFSLLRIFDLTDIDTYLVSFPQVLAPKYKNFTKVIQQNGLIKQ